MNEIRKKRNEKKETKTRKKKEEPKRKYILDDVAINTICKHFHLSELVSSFDQCNIFVRPNNMNANLNFTLDTVQRKTPSDYVLMKVNSQPSLAFVLLRDVTITYMSLNISRRLHASLIGNYIPAMLTSHSSI